MEGKSSHFGGTAPPVPPVATALQHLGFRCGFVLDLDCSLTQSEFE